MRLQFVSAVCLFLFSVVSSRIYRFTPFIAEPVYILPTRYDQQYRHVIRNHYIQTQQQQFIPYMYDPYMYNYQGNYQFTNDIEDDKYSSGNGLGEKPTVNIPALTNGMFNGKITITEPKPIIHIQALANGQFTGPIKVEKPTVQKPPAAAQERRRQKPEESQRLPLVFIDETYPYFSQRYDPYSYPVWDEYMKA